MDKPKFSMQNRASRQFLGLKVGQKIGLGYTLTLGIAVSGTIMGFLLGEHYEQQTEVQIAHTNQEVAFLYSLQSEALQMRTHQQRLIHLVSDLNQFQHEYQQVVQHRAELSFIWGDLDRFVVAQPDAPTEFRDHFHHIVLPDFLDTYDRVPHHYAHALEHLVHQIRQHPPRTPAEIEQAQNTLITFTNSAIALEFEGIANQLDNLINQAKKERDTVITTAQAQEWIAQCIIWGSIVLSIAIAILLALTTSRTIAAPITALTQIAQQVTEAENFELRATVDQDNELGLLAQSFNQLIKTVHQLLQEQQQAKEALESKVAARTQELHEKNAQLQDLLNELQHTQVQMIQSEKMSALGQMVAGVAHEINNPVNFIHGNLVHVQEYAENLQHFIHTYAQCYPQPHPDVLAEAEELDIDFIQADLPKMLNSMQVGTQRIRQIVLSLRNFSRMDEADVKAVDVHEGLDSTLLILQHRLKDKPDRPAIGVIRQYGDLPLVECFPGQLNQVFMNILANAIDALEESRTDRAPADPPAPPSTITIQTSLMEADWVQILIADNGIGMPEAVQQRVFDPFFTTKTVGKGTGMGMPISYQIVTEKHGGQLTCQSSPGQGTTFTIQIPLRQPQMPEPTTDRDPRTVPKTSTAT